MLGKVPYVSSSQSLGDFQYDESELYAETKQVNQFFRRFNGEEDKHGERLYEKDKDFRSYKLRKKYLPGLFNLENSILIDAAKEKFTNLVLDKEDPVYLDFHGGAWLCELKTIFKFKGVEDELTLFLVLQEEEVGSKWVIDGVYFKPFELGPYRWALSRHTPDAYPTGAVRDALRAALPNAAAGELAANEEWLRAQGLR